MRTSVAAERPGRAAAEPTTEAVPNGAKRLKFKAVHLSHVKRPVLIYQSVARRAGAGATYAVGAHGGSVVVLTASYAAPFFDGWFGVHAGA